MVYVMVVSPVCKEGVMKKGTTPPPLTTADA